VALNYSFRTIIYGPGVGSLCVFSAPAREGSFLHHDSYATGSLFAVILSLRVQICARSIGVDFHPMDINPVWIHVDYRGARMRVEVENAAPCWRRTRDCNNLVTCWQSEEKREKERERARGRDKKYEEI